MAGIFLLAQGLYRTYDISRALLCAGAVMVLFNRTALV